MNLKNSNETQARLAVLAELILVGLLVIIALVIFRPGWNLVIALNACSLLLLYRIGSGMYKRRLSRRLAEVSAVIRAVGEDSTSKAVVYEGISDLAEFYEEIKILYDTLAEKEAARQGMLEIVNTIAVNIELEKMLEGIMPQVIAATRSVCSAFYLINPVTNMLEIKHSMGFSKNLYAEFDLSLSEGIVGMAAKSRDIEVLRDVPEDTVYIVRTFLGTIKPRNIMTVPVVNQDQMLGVLLLVSLYDYTQEHIDNMGLMRYYLGVAVHNGVNYEKTKRLSNELKFQNKLIQDLNTDLERKVLDRTMFLNDMIDSIKDYAIYAMDTNGVIVAWNTGAEKLFDLRTDEVLGKHVEIIYDEEPGRRELVQRRIDSALRDGRYTENGWRKKKDEKDYYYELMLFARYSQAGELIGFTNVTRDMTAYKKSQIALAIEKEFSERIIDMSEYALMMLDSEATVVTANSNAKDIFNSYDAVGHSFYNYCRNESEVRKKFATVLEQNVTLEFSAVLRRGGNVNLIVSMIKDADSTTKMLFVCALVE